MRFLLKTLSSNRIFQRVVSLACLLTMISWNCRPVKIDRGISIFFFRINWPRNQPRILQSICNWINLSPISAAHPFFRGWLIISCSFSCSGIWEKFYIHVWNTFHNQVFPEIFQAINFKVLFSSKRCTCLVGSAIRSWDGGKTRGSAKHRIWLNQVSADEFGVIY